MIRMSKERKEILDMFRHRFLKKEFRPKTFSDILNYSPDALTTCSKEQAEILAKNKIKQIRHLSKIKKDKIESLAEKTGLDIALLRQWVLAAQMVSRAWQKRSLYLKKKEMKICVLGLDNAGKSSMLKSLTGKVNLGEIQDLDPTIGVEIQRIQSPNYNLLIWDFGGQVGHRHDYFESPEEYFLQVDLIIYVIDLQDTDRYHETLEYLDQIVDMLHFLGENPYYLILLHKADPDQLEDPEFQMNRDFMHDLVESKLEEYDIHYEIIESSIYNYYATEPDFAKTFKSLFAHKGNQKSTEEMLSALTDTVLKMSAKMMDEFGKLKKILLNGNYQISDNLLTLEEQENNLKLPPLKTTTNQSTKTTPLSPPPALTPPPPPANTSNKNQFNNNKIGEKTGNTKLDLLAELKQVFQLRHLTA